MDLFNFLRMQLPIINVINEYLALKRAGLYWKAPCPFHSEKTASFTVSPHKDIFYCFGCHASGDVVGFIAKMENCSQIEAAKFLVEKYGLQPPKDTSFEFKKIAETIEEKNKYFILCQKVAQWCLRNLNNDFGAKKYLQERGFNQESLNKYTIGYFPSGPNHIKILAKDLIKEGFLLQDLVQANIVMEGKSLYSPFEDRIIFPIKDSMGRFCGFGGRIFKDNDTRAKYYNSHENSYFNKGSLLFGLDLAKKDIQAKGHVFLVEGYTDCIFMSQRGYTNSVAVLGTSCTIEHLKILGRFTQVVYVLYDGDEAGRNAMLRLTQLCWEISLELKVICLVSGEDPASFLNKNGNLKELIDQAKDIYSFFIEGFGSSFSTKSLQEKLVVVKKITEVIRNINDPIKRNILLQETSIRLNIPFDSLKVEFENKDFKKKLISDKIVNKENFELSSSERDLLIAILEDFSLLNKDNFYIINHFSYYAREILLLLFELKSQDQSFDFNKLLLMLSDEHKQFLNRVFVEQEGMGTKDFTKLVEQFKKKSWKKIAYEIKSNLIVAQKNSDYDEVKKLVLQFQELKKKFVDGDEI